MFTDPSTKLSEDINHQIFNWLITKGTPEIILTALHTPTRASQLTKEQESLIIERCKAQDDIQNDSQMVVALYSNLLQTSPTNNDLRLEAITYLIKQYRYEEASELFEQFDFSSTGPTSKLIKLLPLLVQARKYKIAMELSQKALLGLCDSNNDKRHKTSLENTYYTAKLSSDVARLVNLNSKPHNHDIKGYVLIYDSGNKVIGGLMGPISVSLKRDSYAVAAVTNNTFPFSNTGIHEFDQFSGLISNDGYRIRDTILKDSTLYFNWVIDWPNKIIEAEGINFYAYFHERISQKLRCYSADIMSNPKATVILEQLLRQSDAALAFCKRLLPLAKHGKPIRIVVMDSHFAPMGIIREWCAQVGQKYNIHCIALSSAYENYYSNLTTRIATTISIENLTAQPYLRHPFLGGRHRFEQFLKENPNIQANDPEIIGWICMNRSRVSQQMSLQRQQVCQKIEHQKLAGHKVFALLGKVLTDFAAPHDTGLVYKSFLDWLLAIIQNTKDTENLLIIKPHPHELRPEIVVDGVQLLRDLLPTVLPHNIIFLEHDAFNSYELAELVDATFVWNGTALAEFSALGYPTIPGSQWAIHDYPLGLPELKTPEDYEAVLQGDTVISVSDKLRQRATAFLKFLQSDKVAIPYRYLKRASVNQSVGIPHYYPEELEQFLNNGDPYVDCAAERFFEFK